MKTPRASSVVPVHSLGLALVVVMAFVQLPPIRAQIAAGSGTPPDELRLRDYRPRSIYRVPETRPSRARFPVIDVHSHAYVRTQDQVDAWVRTMDEVGIEKTIILSGVTGAEFDAVLARFERHRDRFSIWCGFKLDGADQPGFGPAAVSELDRCRKAGAAGVGELSDKGGGLRGAPESVGLHIDDPRMDPLLEACAEWGMPITTFRILETEDEHFYDWNLFTYHWPLHGFGLSDEVLRKVYGGNARKLLGLPESR
ncbi:MAG: amidohydrolase family protein [Limisphaerales bacterium]